MNSKGDILISLKWLFSTDIYLTVSNIHSLNAMYLDVFLCLRRVLKQAKYGELPSLSRGSEQVNNFKRNLGAFTVSLVKNKEKG